LRKLSLVAFMDGRNTLTASWMLMHAGSYLAGSCSGTGPPWSGSGRAAPRLCASWLASQKFGRKIFNII
ncbi:MAG: hypothetical protein ACK56F_19185, partial [bacterium]